jgi:hypothetical protein
MSGTEMVHVEKVPGGLKAAFGALGVVLLLFVLLVADGANWFIAHFANHQG